MSPRCLPPRTLRELDAVLESVEDGRQVRPETLRRLRVDVAACLKPKKAAKPARVRRVARKATRLAEWEEIKAKVGARSDGCCENCGYTPGVHSAVSRGVAVDHFFGGNGRRRDESHGLSRLSLPPALGRRTRLGHRFREGPRLRRDAAREAAQRARTTKADAGPRWHPRAWRGDMSAATQQPAMPSWWPCEKHGRVDPEWVECGSCGGDGDHDGYEDDPLWYAPGERYRCSDCGGKGGHSCCPGCLDGPGEETP